MAFDAHAWSGQQATVSITTDATNNQAKGTIVVGLNGSRHGDPLTAKLATGRRRGQRLRRRQELPHGTQNNDPSRSSTVQIGSSTSPAAE